MAFVARRVPSASSLQPRKPAQKHHKQESVPSSSSAGISIDPSFLSEPIPVNRTAQAVQDINGYQLYGLDAELEMKRRDKRDPNREIHAMQWIAAILDEPETPSFPDSLRSGILLCRLLNSIFPNRITKIDTRPIPLVERENIDKYLSACLDVGMNTVDLFNISDLYDKKDLEQVLQSLYALSRMAERSATFSGPLLQQTGKTPAMIELPRGSADYNERSEHEQRVARIKEAREEEIKRQTPQTQHRPTPSPTFTPRHKAASDSVKKRSVEGEPHVVLVVHGLLFLILSLALGSIPSALTAAAATTDLDDITSGLLAQTTNLHRLRTDFILTGVVLLLFGAIVIPRFVAVDKYSRFVAAGAIGSAYANAVATFLPVVTSTTAMMEWTLFGVSCIFANLSFFSILLYFVKGRS